MTSSGSRSEVGKKMNRFVSSESDEQVDEQVSSNGLFEFLFFFKSQVLSVGYLVHKHAGHQRSEDLRCCPCF